MYFSEIVFWGCVYHMDLWCDIISKPRPSFSCAKAHHGEVKQTGPHRRTDLWMRHIQTHFRLPFWCIFTFLFVHSQNCYSISSSYSSWVIRGLALTQPDPWHWPYASEHFIPCFGHLHLIVLQSVVQLQWMIFESSRGQEAGQWVWGRTLPLIIIIILYFIDRRQ